MECCQSIDEQRKRNHHFCAIQRQLQRRHHTAVGSVDWLALETYDFEDVGAFTTSVTTDTNFISLKDFC